MVSDKIILVRKDYNNKTIRLTIKQYNHIIGTHPEVKEQINKIGRTIKDPELVKLGNKQDTFLYYKLFDTTPVSKKYLAVIVKYLNHDGFIITAYFTSRIRSGEILWKKE